MKKPKQEENPMPFTRANYQTLIVGVIILVIGYGLLLWPPYFVDSRVFSPALYIAPWVIVGGISTLIYAILRR
ncbi:MAG: DUF3098 domain-containing protein [Bacteroidia bacterium]|nr:DUF3098 domain-containing protein [Bacteroidia bacterium]MDW8088339.1 DUF3098 domain-containing protein [Bacteroidia bacterium]